MIKQYPERYGSLAQQRTDLCPRQSHAASDCRVSRRDTRYEPGQRSGAWRKMRVNQGQEFVIGGYTVGGSTFDALIFGYYENKDLIYVARTRNGFTPRLREDLMKTFRPLETPECPFLLAMCGHRQRDGPGSGIRQMGDVSERGVSEVYPRAALFWSITSALPFRVKSFPAPGTYTENQTVSIASSVPPRQRTIPNAR